MSPDRPHPLRDLGLALSTLTIVPVGVNWPRGRSTDAPGYYPLVGAVLGAIIYGVLRLSDAFGWSGRAPLLVAAGAVALFGLLTRMLHWDGLADVADSFGASTRERRLEIMKDSATGAFGVTAIALGVVIQAAAIQQLLHGASAWFVVVVPALARFSATFAAWFGRPARSEGLGASVIGTPRLGAIVPAAFTLAAIAYAGATVFGTTGLWLTAAGVVMALAIPHAIALRFSGVTGDVMGASVVLVESVLFAACALIL